VLQSLGIAVVIERVFQYHAGMSVGSPYLVHDRAMDWHEVADLRAYTVLSDAGQGGLTDHFAALAAQRDALTVQMWETVALLLERCPASERDFLGDELAGALNVHPETGRAFVATAVRVVEHPVLLEAARRGELTERHVLGALEVLHGGLPLSVRDAVCEAVVLRYRTKAEAPGTGWPTPGELKRALRKELLRHDVDAAAEREKKATERRGVHLSPLPDGQALLCLEGPAAEVLAAHAAIVAATPAAREGDDRSREARSFDTAVQLLTRSPGDDLAGTDARWRGIEVQLITPFSTAQGGDLELAELAGYGPVLPGTARDLMAQAEFVRRVVVDADTGAVLTVDDATRITGDTPAQRAAQVTAAVEQAGTDPVVLRPLTTEAYRPTLRILRHLRLRDRTCVFPGCTRPARWTDADHRVPWPRGSTDDENLQCLCRHHHRAKQARFTVTRLPDGTTVWTSRTTGKRYFRPPPDW
jgi:hypothetical protein